MENLDIEGNLRTYLGDRTPTARYTSFDYCFNYFRGAREEGRLDDLLVGANLQLSCLQLGYYLASWGMFRGGAELLQRSLKALVPAVKTIVSAPAELWDLDADRYTKSNITSILNYAQTLRGPLPGGQSDILVTKVMLGTFCCVPAFDRNFMSGFAVSTFGRKSLRKIGEFYEKNSYVVDQYRLATLDFDSGTPTTHRYTRAKVIDMIFFIEGA